MCYILPIWREAPTELICTKICTGVVVLDVITYAKFQIEIFRGYGFTWGKFSNSLLIFAWTLQQCSANALPVITVSCVQ